MPTRPASAPPPCSGADRPRAAGRHRQLAFLPWRFQLPSAQPQRVATRLCSSRLRRPGLYPRRPLSPERAQCLPVRPQARAAAHWRPSASPCHAARGASADPSSRQKAARCVLERPLPPPSRFPRLRRSRCRVPAAGLQAPRAPVRSQGQAGPALPALACRQLPGSFCSGSRIHTATTRTAVATGTSQRHCASHHRDGSGASRSRLTAPSSVMCSRHVAQSATCASTMRRSSSDRPLSA